MRGLLHHRRCGNRRVICARTRKGATCGPNQAGCSGGTPSVGAPHIDESCRCANGPCVGSDDSTDGTQVGELPNRCRKVHVVVQGSHCGRAAGATGIALLYRRTLRIARACTMCQSRSLVDLVTSVVVSPKGGQFGSDLRWKASPVSALVVKQRFHVRGKALRVTPRSRDKIGNPRVETYQGGRLHGGRKTCAPLQRACKRSICRGNLA